MKGRVWVEMVGILIYREDLLSMVYLLVDPRLVKKRVFNVLNRPRFCID